MRRRSSGPGRKLDDPAPGEPGHVARPLRRLTGLDGRREVDEFNRVLAPTGSVAGLAWTVIDPTANVKYLRWPPCPTATSPCSMNMARQRGRLALGCGPRCAEPVPVTTNRQPERLSGHRRRCSACRRTQCMLVAAHNDDLLARGGAGGFQDRVRVPSRPSTGPNQIPRIFEAEHDFDHVIAKDMIDLADAARLPEPPPNRGRVAEYPVSLTMIVRLISTGSAFWMPRYRVVRDTRHQRRQVHD